MLSNSVIGGVTFALYLTVLVLQINPRYSLAGVPSLAATLILSYGVHASAAFYALIVFRQLVATEVISPGWISFRSLVWVSSGAALAGSLLMWVNLRGFGPVLDIDAQRRMTAGALCLTVCAGLMIALAIGHRWTVRHSSRPGAAALGLTLMASLAVPLMLRGPGTAPAGSGSWSRLSAVAATPAGDRKVTLIVLEGASLDLLAPMAAEGRLPHFARLLEAGASMHVATIRPTQPGPVWTAMATGKLPFKNGIRYAASYYPIAGHEPLEVLPDYCFSHGLVRFGVLRQVIHTSRDLTAHPLWALLDAQGIPVGVVNWAMTQPAQEVRHFIVSDQFDALQQTTVDMEDAGALWPREALAGVAAAASQAYREQPLAGGPPGDRVRDLVGLTCQADRAYEQVAAYLDGRYSSRFLAVRYQCLDKVGEYFLRYAVPGPFGDVSDEEIQKYGAVVASNYAAADAAVGRAVEAQRPGDVLIVASGFGMEPLGVGKRLLDRILGNADQSGTHERAPDGFLLVFGTDVAPGRYSRASLVDVAPTILYVFGLPVPRDMDGFARTDIFTPAFTGRHPITYIPTYER
jgi:predicted AlkP superfamily phosphohydrolase/phosphomutase